MNLSRTKLIIWIILFLVVLAGAGLWLYRRAASPASQAPAREAGISGRAVPIPGRPSPGGATTAPGAPPTPEVVPVAGNPAQRLIRITDFPVVAPSLNKDETKVLFYKKDGGDLFSADPDGNHLQKISNLTILGLLDAVWSPVRDRAAIRYTDGASVKSFLHIGTSSVAVLPAGITSITWSPDGKSLAYTRIESGELALTIADAAGKNPRAVFRTPIRDARVSWSVPDTIIFATPASGIAEGYVFSYSRSKASFEKILGPSYGLGALASAYASHLLISSTPRGGDKMTTAVYDSTAKKSLKIASETFAEKCLWAGKEDLWCAVPRDLTDASPLPDRYLTGEYNSSDRIVRIDTAKNDTEEIFNEGDYDMSDLILSKNKNYLFFANRKDGTLWSLMLK